MPLVGDPKKDIKELYRANKSKPKGKKRSRKQMLAIAMDSSKNRGKY